MARIDFDKGVIEMSHGSGGQAMAQLIEQLFLTEFNNEFLAKREDGARFNVKAGRMVMATDSHVISPLFFPGGDIGSLAVYGTVNDVAMSGAVPLYLSCGFILEEGFPLKSLKAIVCSMAAAARRAGIMIISGDTKVVERGKGDGVFINTTGIGMVPVGVDLGVERIKAGDSILVSGTLGDHGATILSLRENLQFHTMMVSDSAPLNHLVVEMVRAVPDIHCLRDPTRGGLAAVLNELASQSGLGIKIAEEAIPYKAQVRAACELFGLEPLHMANEGKLVAFCPAGAAEALLGVMRNHPLAHEAAIIGEVVEGVGYVELETVFGTKRLLDWPAAEQLPRIC